MNSYENDPNGPLTLSLFLEEDSILVSSAILLVLEHPQQLQILINEEQKMLLLQACTVEDREALIIPPSSLSLFEVSGHSLLKRIRKLTGWVDNTPRAIDGEYIPNHCAVVFNLLAAYPSPFQMPLGEITSRPC